MTTQERVTDAYATKPWLQNYDPGVPAEIEIPDKALFDFLVENAAARLDQPAVIFYNRAMTYRELLDSSRRFANLLIQHGVRHGDRVALLMPNCPQFVFAYYGTLMAGAVVVPSNPLYVEHEVEQQLQDSGARVILTLSKFWPVVEHVRDRTPIEHTFVTNIKEYFPIHLRYLFTLFKERKEGHRVRLPSDGRTEWLQDALRTASNDAPNVQVGPEDLAVLQYTGGTTGTSKGAQLSHRNLISNLIQARAWQAAVPPTEHPYDVAMGVLPLFHTYGMSTVMNTVIIRGGTMILVPRFEFKPVLQAITKYRPNLFPGVPTMYSALNHYPGIEKYDLSSVALCVSGGAALPVEVKHRFEQLTGATVAEGYGLSEASPVTHCNPLAGESRPGSIGLPFPSTDARIVDSERGERILPPGEVGELIIRGPQIMRGYWNRPDETAQVLRDGWLFTGDLGTMDEDGYFRIVDRKKDMIISGGFNVYPRELEEVLYAHPKVKDAVAVGIPDERWGEKVKAYVVLKEGETATERELIDYCHERLAAFKVPKEIEFRESLPTSMIGKVLRRVLREEAVNRRDAENAERETRRLRG